MVANERKFNKYEGASKRERKGEKGEGMFT